MDASLLDAYIEPRVHEAVARIIRRYSTNPEDLRRETLKGVDLSEATRLLDLGCGYGSMLEALVGKVPADAEVIGVDMHCSNEPEFLERAGIVTSSARFVCRTLDSHLDFPSRFFDAVIAAYSLYFFPRLIPEVARVLRPDGVLVAVTHSESSFRGMLASIGIPYRQSAFHALLSGFSAENGSDKLARHFGIVERRPYPNTLVFSRSDVDDYMTLIRFKLPSLLPDGQGASDLPARAREMLVRDGCVTIDKDDAVFAARKPRPS
jgi:SAM-dependent methyltransferase